MILIFFSPAISLNTTVIIDDCWQGAERDPKTQEIPADPKKFPSGMKALADKIHGLGLKAGIYSSAGVKTCGGRIGSLDMETVDAKSWADAGFDYLKYDNCYNQGRSGNPQISFDRYNAMSKALNATGRPILYSMCNWGEDWPWLFATEIANSWRISGDIYDNFARPDSRCPCDTHDCSLQGYHCSVKKILNIATPLGQKAGPGRWLDLDMLEVGNGGMTRDEYVTHFSMWAMLKSALILGNDVTDMSNETRAIITNKHVIDISQDGKGSPAIQIWKKPVQGGDVQLWVDSLENGTYAVALINMSPHSQKVGASYTDIFLDEGKSAWNAKWDAYDLWAHVDFESAKPTALHKLDGSPFSDKLPEFTIPAHGVKLLKLAREGTNGKGMPASERRKREVEQAEHMRMGRAREWMAAAEDRRRDMARDAKGF